ncbi:hypothetical protein KC19_VG010500 [Ceratodon purpureus]|uniref:Uncharacterized protein n=1 Tax=Ceratodon purpureus TaxID=3225 RepID=A0A8T0HKV4_CERPU|nr:hypothetical protein KC19_VG010500 [Ceratodon purpureus]
MEKLTDAGHRTPEQHCTMTVKPRGTKTSKPKKTHDRTGWTTKNTAEGIKTDLKPQCSPTETLRTKYLNRLSPAQSQDTTRPCGRLKITKQNYENRNIGSPRRRQERRVRELNGEKRRLKTQNLAANPRPKQCHR